jgi:copper chaperone CopZ
MNKNNLLPISIIAVALLIGNAVLYSGQNKDTNFSAYPNNTRALTLSIPGMVCAGCAASVEGYVKAMPGVVEASVALTTKSGIFLYDPSKVTKEQIVKNTIFDIYAPVIVSDEKYDPSRHRFAKENIQSIPIAIQQKSNRVSQLFTEKQKLGVDVTRIQTGLDKVDEFLQKGLNQEAERLLDEIIKELENL